jgi:hypothetical protein
MYVVCSAERRAAAGVPIQVAEPQVGQYYGRAGRLPTRLTMFESTKRVDRYVYICVYLYMFVCVYIYVYIYIYIY